MTAETHIAKSDGRHTPNLFATPPSGRVLALCGVTCDANFIVTELPTCSWCQRALEEGRRR